MILFFMIHIIYLLTNMMMFGCTENVKYNNIFFFLVLLKLIYSLQSLLGYKFVLYGVKTVKINF